MSGGATPMWLPEEDPKGLLREAYAIDGITAPECRSIFLDWALSVPEASVGAASARLCAHYSAIRPDHPMTAVLTEAVAPRPDPARRGGRAGRIARDGGRS
jgi:hypothetical protein